MIRVLVLDPDTTARAALSEQLLCQIEPDLDIATAATLAEACQALERAATLPDAILIAHRPSTGLDCVAEIEELHRRFPKIEIIVLDDGSDARTDQRAREAGAYRCLPAQYDPRELAWMVGRLHKWRQTRDERDWLMVLIGIVEKAHRAPSRRQVAEIIVQGGRDLAFERARLWQISDDGKRAIGASQSGNQGLGEFEGFQFTATDSPYMRRVLLSREPVVFQGQEHGDSYLYKFFREHGYQAPIGEWVGIPLWVDGRCWGVLMLDNADQAQKLHAAQRDLLSLLGRQIAAVLERAWLSDIKEQLTDLNSVELSNFSDLSLKRTLARICEAAQVIMSADCVVIYPLRSGGEPYLYDVDNVSQVGMRLPRAPRDKPRQAGLTAHIMRSGPLMVPNITRNQEHDDPWIVRHPFVQREEVRAFIGVPIRDTTSEPLGVLYLNYRTPRSFTEHDRNQSAAFANLAAVAIRNSWTRRLVRSSDSAQAAEAQHPSSEDEPKIIQRVLEEALTADTSEDRVVRALLGAARELLYRPNAWVGLILRKWKKPERPDQEPREVRHYFLHPDGRHATLNEQDLFLGITGQAFLTGKTQLAPNVREGRWAKIFHQGPANNTWSEMDIPIKLGDLVIGVLSIESPDEGAFTSAHRTLMERLATVAALALDNVRRQDYLQSVLNAARSVVAPYSLQATLQSVSDAARRVSPGISALTIWYREPEGRRILLGPFFGVRNASLIGDVPGIDGSVVQTVMEAPEPIWAEAAASDQRLAGRFIAEEEIASVAAFSLCAGADQVGAMFFNYRQTHRFTAQEKVLFPIIAAIAAASVRDALLLEAALKESKRLRAATAITEAIGTTLDIDQTLRTIMGMLRELFPQATPCVMVYLEAEHVLEFTLASQEFYPVDNQAYEGYARLDVEGPGIAAKVARDSLERRAVTIVRTGCVEQDPAYLNLISSTKSELCISLINGGMLHGVLVLESPLPDAFDEDDAQLVENIARQIGLAIDRAYQSARLRFQTALAARTVWAAEIAHDVNREVSLIRNHAYWLRSEATLSEPAARYTHEIDTSAARLAEIVSNAVPRYVRTPERLVLDTWIRQAIAEIVTERGEELDLQFELTCGDLAIQSYPIALKRILRHLIRNAARIMSGSGTITVRTRRDRGDRVEIQVEDTGPGVPMDLRPLIFQQPVVAAGSTGGMGLLLVRFTAEEMGGSIRLLPSGAEGGAVFALTLPIAR